MNENNTPLIGTPVNVTVFMVTYEYSKPKREAKVPRSAKGEIDKVRNQVPIVSGDASGADIFPITRRLVLGPNPYAGNDFRILASQRVVDAMGLATATTWDKLDGQAPEDFSSVSTEISVTDDDGSGEDGSGQSDPDLN